MMERMSRYLIISNENKSKKNLHDNIRRLKKSISDTTELVCEEKSIKIKTKSFSYKLKMMDTEIQEENKKFFILVVNLSDEDNIDEFELLDAELHSFIDSFTDLEMFILEDAISQYYSKKAYELIHVIENKTRALISEVMFLKSKTQNWEKRLTKSLAIRDNNKSKKKNYKPLDGKYFSDLPTMLFAIYEDKKPDEDSTQENFIKVLESLKNLTNDIDERFTNSTEEIDWESHIKELKDIDKAIQGTAPRSVWDRYISRSIDGSEKLSNSLSTVLNQLKDPRNDIAHNTFFRRDDYVSIKENIEKVSLQISKALDSFEDKTITKYTTIEENEMFETLDALIGIQSDESNNLEDDLTLIVPAQEEGFKEAFLEKNEWYDIRIGKRRTKIRYIAGYEVKPRSGIQYIAKVKDIIPSENYLGYWKVIFDGKAQAYDHLIPLGNTYPPQNIRYTTKRELDEVAENNETLEKIFKNPY